MIEFFEQMSYEEKERRFYGKEEVVGGNFKYPLPVPLSHVKKMGEEEQRTKGIAVKRKVYDPVKGYKVSKIVYDGNPLLFDEDELTRAMSVYRYAK